MIRYYWCSICKTASAWNLDFSGCYPETLLFPCKCGQFDKAHEWESIRKFVRLPEIPIQGAIYEFDVQEQNI